jgi:hypothetical protein
MTSPATSPATSHATSSGTGSRLALTLLLCLATGATFLTALAFGWLQVYFHLFGEQADRADYATAVGVLGTGAALLALAVPVTYLFRLPWAPAVLACCGALVLVLLAVAAAGQMDAAQPSEFGNDSWTAGIGTLLIVPWCWSMPALTLGAVITALCAPDPARR